MYTIDAASPPVREAPLPWLAEALEYGIFWLVRDSDVMIGSLIVPIGSSSTLCLRRGQRLIIQQNRHHPTLTSYHIPRRQSMG